MVTSLHAGGGDFRFPVRATVEQGVIEGSYDTKTGLQSYLGVPFARPPIGELRWKAPQPLEKWSGVRPAKKFGPRAMQAPIYSDMTFESDGISEDCLYLNVWTPAKRDTAGLPVLVYFYGGGFVAGDGSEPRYNGASMAAKGIVAVTANYRLNVFGFLAHPDLTAESPHHASGNYGLLDQQAVLAWVQKNIAAFGGDPKKVTIAGESAGSISVSYQMASPLSKNLFARAIGESGSGIKPTLSPVPLAEAERIGKEFLDKAGVHSIADAKRLDARAIYEIYNESKRFGFPPVIDGYFLKKTLPETFAAREQAQVPLLVGWNSAEISGSGFMHDKPYQEPEYIAQVKETYPQHADELLKLYPHGSTEEIARSATALASDRFIVYSTYRWFDLQRKNSDQPVYRYLYSKLRPPMRDARLAANPSGGGVIAKPASLPAPKALGAPHACEIEYCMGNLPLVHDYAWTEDDYKVSRTMQSYFANFIKTGNPNGEGLPDWPAAAANDPTPPVMVIDTESSLQKAETDSRYAVLEKALAEPEK
ncbi:MAG TPA: carboxylesterase family protein [Opitutaceae bacterium]|nr:carboxylesterase family protein [Opitutaceae bacterium]